MVNGAIHWPVVAVAPTQIELKVFFGQQAAASLAAEPTGPPTLGGL